MVVAMHSNLFAEGPAELHFWLLQVVFRVAVPFFVICTGYFLTGKLEFDGVLADTAANRQVFLRQWKKLIRLYAVWTMVYLAYSIPGWIETGWFSPMAFVDYAVATLTVGSHYHLWYLWAMIYTLPVFWLVLRRLSLGGLKVLAALLWLAEVLVYAYHHLLPTGLAELILKFGFLDSFLRILAFLVVGAVIFRDRKMTGRLDGIGFLVCFALLSCEAFWLRGRGQTAVSYIVMTLPAAWFLFRLIVDLKLPGWKIGCLPAVSTTVYCVHPILVELPLVGSWNSLVRFLFVAASATLFGIACEMLRRKLRRKR